MLRTVRNALVGVWQRVTTLRRRIRFRDPFWWRSKEKEDGSDVASVEAAPLVENVEVIEYARVEVEESFSGRSRLRCTVCDKVAFRTEKEALINRDYIFMKGGPRMRQYKGRYPRVYGQNKGTPCGWWHLSRGRKR